MRCAFLSFPLLVSMTAAQAAPVDGTNPGFIAELMRSEGFPIELTTDNTGDPQIRGKFEGSDFSLFFYGCTNNARCSSVQFIVGFNMANGMQLAQANEWNRDNRFSSVYLDDENDPFLQMDVNLEYGVDEVNFLDTFNVWRSSMSQFKDFIDW